MTFTFDRYRGHCLTSQARCGLLSELEMNPTAGDVRSGMTRSMPTEDRYRAYIGDIHKWYLRLLRQMYGRYRDRYRAWHPRGIGFLDEPVGKSPGVGIRRHAGDEFLHAHLLLRIDDDCSKPPTTDELDSFVEVMFNSELDSSNVVRFERLNLRGVLEHLWFDQNPDGNLWIKELEHGDDVARSLDYIGKSAKRDQSLFDHCIFLPFA
jgi:hypothetical protein